VRNKEKAKILIGKRNPVVSSAATPAPSGGGQTVYNTAVQYIETGIKLEVEPQIHPDGDVAIKLALEVSSAGAQIDTGNNGTVVFPITTNNVNTLLQLRDGETQILGGLIQHQNDQSQTKIPGFGDLPLVGRLFGSVTDTWNKKELIMAITPHIVRNTPIRDADAIELWSGTEGRIRYGAPNVRVSGSNGVMPMQSGTGAGGALPATPYVAPPAAPIAAPSGAVVRPLPSPPVTAIDNAKPPVEASEAQQ